MTAMVESKKSELPDEVRMLPDKSKVELIRLAGHTVGKATFEPGWKWSVHVKPIAGTELCEQTHLGFCLSGRTRVTMADGSERMIEAGELFFIPPGHDGETVGDEAFVALDFLGMEDYAKRRAEAPPTRPREQEQPEQRA